MFHSAERFRTLQGCCLSRTAPVLGDRAACRLTIHAGIEDAYTGWPGLLEQSIPECWTAGGTLPRPPSETSQHVFIINSIWAAKVILRLKQVDVPVRRVFGITEISSSAMTENSQSIRCDCCDCVGLLLHFPNRWVTNPQIWLQLDWAMEGRVYLSIILLSEQSNFVSMLGILGGKRTIGHKFMDPVVRLQFSCLLLVLEPCDEKGLMFCVKLRSCVLKLSDLSYHPFFLWRIGLIHLVEKKKDCNAFNLFGFSRPVISLGSVLFRR